MTKGKKYYIITLADPGVNKSDLASVLGLEERPVLEAVEAMEGEYKAPQETDIMYYENLGSVCTALTEQQAEALRKNERVIEVLEDFEVHTLALPQTDFAQNDADQLESSFFNESDLEPNGLDYGSGAAQAQPEWAVNAGQALQQLLDSYQDYQFWQNTLQRVPSQPIAPAPRPVFPPIPLPTQPIPWNISMVRAPRAWRRCNFGRGTRLAIIDTGIFPHRDLAPIAGGASFVPGVASHVDDNGHGTHCAGIAAGRNNFFGIVGVAPGASLYSVKVLNSTGSGMFSWILAGMSWAVHHRMHVVSMSLGAGMPPTVALTNAVNQLNAAGVTVVAAAGNSFGSSFPFVNAPANSRGVIAVGAIDQAQNIAGFSSRGGGWNQVTVVAPGVNIRSTVLNNGFGVMSGTSMAAPHVAGAVCLIKARFPAATPAQIVNRLRSTATDLGPAGIDVAYGAGLINCDAATL